MADREILFHGGSIHNAPFLDSLVHKRETKSSALALVQKGREADGFGAHQFVLLRRFECADLIANPTVHAFVLIHYRILESHSVRLHANGTVRTGIRAGTASTAFATVVNSYHLCSIL